MIDQDEFNEYLTQALTPQTLRESTGNGNGDLGGNLATWYNTPCASVAAARSTAVCGSSMTAQASPEIRHAEWGRRRLPDGPSPDEGTLFQACSISKAFQSLAILHFYSEGIIKSLDEPVRSNLGEAGYDILLQNAVSRGVPEDVAAQLLDRVTITQLLSHTAGTTASGFPGYSPESDHIKTSAEVLRGGLGSGNSPPVYVHGIPGLQWQYSGGGSTVLQAMLENMGREQGYSSYALLMKEKVLDPLGMARSFYCDAAPLPKSEANHATAYQNGACPLENRQDFHVHPEQGAAGLWTTSVDLVKGLLGVAHTALGTSSAVRLDGTTWIKPGIAQEIFKKRPELAHQGDAYFCGFQVEFLDGEDQFPGDEKLVRISHAGGNEGYVCWHAASFPVPSTVEGGDEIVINAMACMTNSNYGDEICGPMICAVSEMLDSPLGGGPPDGPFSGNVPFVAVDPTPPAPWAGWAAYEGKWKINSRAQTLEITTGPGPGPGPGPCARVVEFSHLKGVMLPLVGCAARKSGGRLRLRVSSLNATLDFGSERGEVSLSLCTGGARLECSR